MIDPIQIKLTEFSCDDSKQWSSDDPYFQHCLSNSDYNTSYDIVPTRTLLKLHLFPYIVTHWLTGDVVEEWYPKTELKQVEISNE